MRQKNRLSDMENKAKQIKKIQFICNTILSNCCYHTKEMETQIMIAEKSGNMTNDEKDLICRAWDYRNRVGKELMTDLKEYMSSLEGKNEKKEHGNKKG
jgi:hypothetical protein